MEILLGNLGEGGGGGNCMSGGKNRWLVINNHFQHPFSDKLHFCVCVWGEKVSVEAQGLLHLRQFDTLQSCPALFLQSIMLSKFSSKSLLPGLEQSSSKQAMFILGLLVKCNPPFRISLLCVLHTTQPSWSSCFLKLRAQSHTKGTHGQENPLPGQPGDEIHKCDHFFIIFTLT